MITRSHKIMAMVPKKKPETENVVNDLIPKVHKNQNQIQGSPKPELPCATDEGNIDDDLNDTNSIADSQYTLGLSSDDSNDNSFQRKHTGKPNIRIEDSESSSDSGSESDGTSGTEGFSVIFSSDDSVKDPNFLATDLYISSDSDNDERHFSVETLQDRMTRDEDLQSNEPQVSFTQLSPSIINIQPLGDSNEPNSVDAQPASVNSYQPSSVQSAGVDTPSSCVEVESRSRSRKRKANPDLWLRNQSKLLRNSGKAYVSMSKTKKVFAARKMGPTCTDKCKLKCSERFSTEERQVIFETYWKLADLQIQRQFVYNHMAQVTPKYRYTRVGSKRKNFNNSFYLTKDRERIRVCKVFFMNTLNLSDKAIRTVVKKFSTQSGDQEQEHRGRHDSHKKIDSNLIDGVKTHINSIPRVESHYCRARSKREYIEGGHTIASLYRDYVEKSEAEGVLYVSYQIYYNTFNNEFNISFWQPKKDQCEDCTAYINAEDKLVLQENYDTHLREKTLARAEKDRDKENVCNNFVVAVYDLQAVMPCPKGEVSSFYYISKLNLFNFTITELGTKNTTCFVWHEGEGARGVNEIGSCVLMYLQSLHDKATEDVDVIFYSDNCCGQQKNKFMLAMYQYALRKYPKLKSITHKFLIKGHTQNEGDAVHSTIQRNISRALKSNNIYVPDQYIILIKTAKKKGNPYTIVELNHDGFFDLKPLASGNYNINENGDKLKWSDIKIIKVQKDNEDKFFYKTSYEQEEFDAVSTLKKRRTNLSIGTTTPKKLYNNKLEISVAKKQGILKLIEKNVIPKYYESFYTNL